MATQNPLARRFKSAILLFLTLVQASESFAHGFVALEDLSSRKSADFSHFQDAKVLVPKGTTGTILRVRRLPSGNFGLKVRIESVGSHYKKHGQRVRRGQVAWLYYHADPAERNVSLSDRKGRVTESPKRAKSATTETTLQVSIPPPQGDPICTECAVGSSDGSESSQVSAQPVENEVLSDVEDIAETVAPPPTLSIPTEEVLTYLNRVKPGQPAVNRQIAEQVVKESGAYSIPTLLPLVLGIMRQESQFNPNAHSGAGAQGLMQLMPGTRKLLLVGEKSAGPYEISENIRLGVKHIAELYQTYGGNLRNVLIAYNAGGGRVGKPRIPRETRAYIPKVLAYYREYESSVADGSFATREQKSQSSDV
jgi:hypothetical protein